jgi:hypothetical protein
MRYKEKRRPVFLFVSIAIFLIALSLIVIQNMQNINLPGFSLLGSQEISQPTEYSIKKPEEVVRQYFESWDKKDYPNMYATLSDGFKRIDNNAKDLVAFRNFASSQGIDGVKIISVKESSNDGKAAIVEYKVEFIEADGSKQTFSDKFTLKLRNADVVQGWKLIHPYGENIDTS